MNMRVMIRRSHTGALAAKAAALAAMLVTTAADAAVYYVDKNYAGTEVGTDPDQPFNTIREAVNAAKANVGADEIRIAAGTYDDAREQWSTLGQFDISTGGGLTVRGGYGGVGNWASRTSRATVIDLAGGGARAFYHTDSDYTYLSLAFDGLTFQRATNANSGAAVYVTDTGRYDRDLLVTNCLFRNNCSTGGDGGALHAIAYNGLRIVACDFHTNSVTGSAKKGGAAYATGSATGKTLTDAAFIGNTAKGLGGALLVPGQGLSVARCLFDGNAAASGGAAASESGIAFDRCVFRRNTCTSGGAALYTPSSGGAAYSISLRNCLVHDNSGGYAVKHEFSKTTVQPTYLLDILHTTIADNPGGGVEATDNNNNWTEGDARIRNSVVANNGAVGIRFYNNQWNLSGEPQSSNALYAAYNDVYGHTTADYQITKADGPTDSLSLDPKFVSASADNYRLTVGSPCRNAATNLSVTVDLEGNARPFNAKDIGIDMGCYETAPPSKGTAVMVR